MACQQRKLAVGALGTVVKYSPLRTTGETMPITPVPGILRTNPLDVPSGSTTRVSVLRKVPWLPKKPAVTALARTSQVGLMILESLVIGTLSTNLKAVLFGVSIQELMV